MKLWIKILIAIGLLIAGLAAYVFTQVHQLDHEQITDDVHVIYGLGGNVGVLKTDAGTVIVDTMTFKYQGGRIRALAEELTGKAVITVINSHYHFDHTHGNPAFEPGTRVVSTPRTLDYLEALDAEYFSGDAAALLPNDTYDRRQHIEIGNKLIELIPTGAGHTDGDLAVYFVEDGVLHTGDLFFNRLYPNIDLEAGGSIVAWGDTLDELLSLPLEKIIPGHGPVSGMDRLLEFQSFIRQLADVGRVAAQEGWSREETQASDLLTADEGFEPIGFLGLAGLDRDFVLGRTWDEATGNFTLRK